MSDYFSNILINEYTIFTSTYTDKVLYILRGIPCTGKSTYIRNILGTKTRDIRNNVCSSDDFYETVNGQEYLKASIDDIEKYTRIYNFDPTKPVHYNNQNRAYDLMASGTTPIFIDNTNINLWEMKAYTVYGILFNYTIKIVEFDPSKVNNTDILACIQKRGKETGKNIPDNIVINMIANLSRNLLSTMIETGILNKILDSRIPDSAGVYLKEKVIQINSKNFRQIIQNRGGDNNYYKKYMKYKTKYLALLTKIN